MLNLTKLQSRFLYSFLILIYFLSRARANENSDINKQLISSNTKFSFKLFSEILKKNPGENVFVSPYSISTALTMTCNGAGGETQEAMAGTLELQNINLGEVNKASLILKKKLENSDPKVQLFIANSLWARKGYPFYPDFMQTNKTYFQAEVQELDFGAPDSPSRINKWVKEKTKNKIDKIVDEIKPEHILFLINAIYFKGMWTVQFDKSKTTNRKFYLLNGKRKTHPMMLQSGEYKYFQGTKFQAVSLPYGNGQMSMYVFLPDRDSSISEFQVLLTYENWENWMSQFHIMEGTVALPRFKIEYEAELSDVLKALGMGEAFDETRANFQKMTSVPGIYLSKVSHKTFVDVNEEGTEAAAVTSVEMGITSVARTFTIVVDRPFFAAIRDNKTGSLLFMGIIFEPK